MNLKERKTERKTERKKERKKERNNDRKTERGHEKAIFRSTNVSSLQQQMQISFPFNYNL